MRRLDSNTWLVLLAVILFVAGALVAFLSGSQAFPVHCCF